MPHLMRSKFQTGTPCHNSCWPCSRLRRGQAMIFWAVFMTLCTSFLLSAVDPVYHTPRQYIVQRSSRTCRKCTAAGPYKPGPWCWWSRSGLQTCGHPETWRWQQFPPVLHLWGGGCSPVHFCWSPRWIILSYVHSGSRCRLSKEQIICTSLFSLYILHMLKIGKICTVLCWPSLTKHRENENNCEGTKKRLKAGRKFREKQLFGTAKDKGHMFDIFASSLLWGLHD